MVLFSLAVDERLEFEIYLKFTNFFSYTVATQRMFQGIKIMETNRSMMTFSNHTDNRPAFVFNGYRS